MIDSNSPTCTEKDQAMPQGYVPNKSDILCGRGKANAKHPGNIMFNALVRTSLEEYNKAPSRIEKSIVVSSVVSYLQGAGMRFLKFDPLCKQYVQLPPERTHDKVGHAIRDLLKVSKKGVAKKAVAAVRKQSIPDAVHSIDEPIVPNNILSADTTTSSLPSLDITKQPLSCCHPMRKESSLPIEITNELFSMSEYRSRDEDMTLEKLIYGLGSPIEDNSKELLAEIKEDILSMDNDDLWKQQSDKPLPLESNTIFECHDVELLEDMLGLGQL